MRLRARAPVHVGRGAGPLAVQAGAVWVARPEAGTVTRLGAGGQRVVRVGSTPVSLALGFGKLWVALRDVGLIDTVNLRTLAARSATSVPTPVRVFAGHGLLWVLSLDNAALYPVNPANLGQGAPIEAPDFAPVDMAPSGNELWLLSARDSSLGPVNFTLGRILRAGFALPGRALSGLSSGDGLLWAGEPTRRELLRVDATTVAVRELPAPFGMRPVATAVGACGVWVGGESGTVALIDPNTGAPLAPAVRIGASVGALAASGTGVWVSDPLDGTVSRVSAVGG
jgi:hypothetical protein